MKKHFPGYYPPTEKEFIEIWKTCFFSFDVNVLLDIYRYSEHSRNNLFQILGTFKDRLWLTNQAALEFHRNILTVKAEQLETYEQIRKFLPEVIANISNRYQTHPYIDLDKIKSILTEGQTAIESELTRASEAHPQNVTEIDELQSKLNEIFDGKVGDPYSPDDHKRLIRVCEERFNKKIPPGYIDRKQKDGDEQYGDALIWFQLMDFAKSTKAPVVFVTSERKADWWLKHDRKIVGPRPELIQEMLIEAEQQFYMYSPDRFIEFAQKHLKLEDKKVVEEVREITRHGFPVDDWVVDAYFGMFGLNAIELCRLWLNNNIGKVEKDEKGLFDCYVRHAADGKITPFIIHKIWSLNQSTEIQVGALARYIEMMNDNTMLHKWTGRIGIILITTRELREQISQFFRDKNSDKYRHIVGYIENEQFVVPGLKLRLDSTDYFPFDGL